MGVVKYTGPVASFHCPTNAEIRSLKVHFSPKQLGEGDPSPENIREIVGWDGVEVSQHGRNLYSKDNVIPHTADDEWNCIMSGAKQKIAVNSWPRWTFLAPAIPNAIYYWTASCYEAGFLDKDKNVLTYKSGWNNTNVKAPANATYVYHTWIKNESMSQEQLDVAFKTYDLYCDMPPTVFEEQNSKKMDYEFGALGKNKLPITANMEIKSINTNYDNTLQRDMTPGILYPNVSANNYWLGTSAKTFVQEVQNGSITFQGSNSAYGIGTIVSVQPQVTYTISYTTSDNQVMIRIGYYDADGYFTGTHRVVNSGASFTIPNDVYHMIIVATPNTGYSNQLITVSNLQLELGSTATEYEPYNPNNTVYGGWVDLISGEVAEEYYYTTIYNADDFSFSARNGCNRFRKSISGFGVVAKGNIHIYFNYLPQTVNVPWSAFVDVSLGSSNARLDIYTPTSFTDTATLSSYLLEHPLEFCFELKTPITYHLAPTQLQTFLGQNNVWSNADYVEVEYDLHETQDILARKQFIMANQPHVEILTPASLQSFNTNMAAPLKECKVYFEPIQDLHGYSKPWIGGTGKNLFNINAVEQNPSDTTAVNTTNRIFTPGTYAVGASWSNWWQANQVVEYSISNGNLFVKNNNVYGVGFAFKLVPEETYFLSATANNGNAHVIHYDSEGTAVSPIATQYLNSSFTVPSEADITVIVFFTKNTGTDGEGTTFSNIQLQKGSTATSWEPYENICPISGRTELEVQRTGKNLIDESYLANANNYPNAGSYGYYYTNDIQLVPNTRYRFVWYDYDNTALSELGVTNINLYVSGANEYIVNNANYRQYSSGFITSATGIIRLGIYHPSTLRRQDILDAIFNNGKLLLQVGTDDIAYTPYFGMTLPIAFPSEAGTIYGGYVDLVNGELVATNSRKIFTGEENWGSSQTANFYTPTDYSGQATLIQCSHFPSNSMTTTGTDNNCYISGSGYLNLQTTAINHMNSAMKAYCAKQYANNTPLMIVYPITPITYQLSPQLLKTLRGANNIWFNSNGPIDIKYWTH